MSKSLLIASALSLNLAFTPMAMARPNSDRDDRGRPEHHDDRGRGGAGSTRGHAPVLRYDGNTRGSHHDTRRDPRRDHDHRWAHRPDHRWAHRPEHRWSGPRYVVPRYPAPRGYVARHWRAGYVLPPSYRAPRYVVHDYRHYQLYAPPRGHHWVRVDHDVVLTAVATGVITAVVVGLFQ